jgi:hypothetical protein
VKKVFSPIPERVREFVDVYAQSGSRDVMDGTVVAAALHKYVSDE